MKFKFHELFVVRQQQLSSALINMFDDLKLRKYRISTVGQIMNVVLVKTEKNTIHH